MSDRVVVCVGTKRGLFFAESNAKRERWRVSGPHLKGWQVYHAIVDARNTPRVHAAASSDVFAGTVFAGGRARPGFRGAKRPPVPPPLLPKQLKQIRQWGIPTTPRVWHIQPGRAAEKHVLYAGTAPAALFRSEDDGRSWEIVEGLLKHPTRKHWTPGAGGQCLHSIQLDPADPNRMYVGISSPGVFRTDDGGRTWKPINEGVKRFPEAPRGLGVGT